MTQKIKITTLTKKYEIVVKQNSIIENIQYEQSRENKIFIIIDKKVFYLLKDLKKNNNTHIIKIDGGEKIKSIKTFSYLSSKLFKLNIDRKSTIIAIGGGTIGDLSGFIASTILRGVKLILIPTTLLSQVDSSIGGKNGINTTFGKNLIGTFLPPDKVIIDISCLLTLSKREIKSGYAEILKHSLIKDRKFFNWLKKNHKQIFNIEPTHINSAIIKSIKIKAFFVEKDEKENLISNFSRAMLNFGHTFGHAFETLNNFQNKLTHGEAISIGMSLACKISFKLKLIKKNDYERIIEHLKNVGLPYSDKRIKNDNLYNIMASDKKNSNNKINLILLNKIGQAKFKIGMRKDEIKKLLN